MGGIARFAEFGNFVKMASKDEKMEDDSKSLCKKVDLEKRLALSGRGCTVKWLK